MCIWIPSFPFLFYHALFRNLYQIAPAKLSLERSSTPASTVEEAWLNIPKHEKCIHIHASGTKTPLELV